MHTTKTHRETTPMCDHEDQETHYLTSVFSCRNRSYVIKGKCWQCLEAHKQRIMTIRRSAKRTKIERKVTLTPVNLISYGDTKVKKHNSSISGTKAPSTQERQTPDELITAIENFTGRKIGFDLAASKEMHKHPAYFDIKDDSLTKPWAQIQREGQFLWLNPPFKTVRPWMIKCAEEANKGAFICSLVLNSRATNWYKEIARPLAQCLILDSRVTFGGMTQPFPKELQLIIWSKGATSEGYFDWKRWV